MSLRSALALALSLVALPCSAAPLHLTHPLVEGLGSTAVDKLMMEFRDQERVAVRVEVAGPNQYLNLPPGVDPAAMPDAALLYAEAVAQLAEADLIVPLDDLLDAPTRADFVDGVLDTTTYKGHLWAIPVQANPYGLFCNMALFRAAGVAPPRTWDETLAAARKLTRDTDGDGRIDTWGYTQCVFQFPLIMWQYGGSFLNADGTGVGFDSRREMIEALRLYVELRRCSPQHVDFERGDVAMKISVVRNIPRYAHLDFRVLPIPSRNGRRINAFGESAGPLCLVVFKHGEEREAAARRLVSYWLRPHVALWYATWTGGVPLRKSVLAYPAYRRYLDRHPHQRAFAGELPYARARPCLPQYPHIRVYLSNASNGARDENTTDRLRLGVLLRVAARDSNALFGHAP
jgi:multiple sugar transport system substrate-binding protein